MPDIIGTLQAVAPALATQLTMERLEMASEITDLRSRLAKAEEIAMTATKRATTFELQLAKAEERAEKAEAAVQRVEDAIELISGHGEEGK